MRIKALTIISAIVAATLSPHLAPAGAPEDAAERFVRGHALLAQADFAGALDAYADAARTDATHTEYKNQYAILRRVIELRDGLDRESNPQRWERKARSLRGYYYNHEIYTEALELDRAIHEKLETVESATMLAETYLQLDRDAEAEAILAGIDKAAALPYGRLLYGIALARQGKIERARTVAESIQLPQQPATGLLYQSARLCALTSDEAGALSHLTRTLASIPPSRLPAARDRIRACSDFRALAGEAAFDRVLATESKVPESKCSGGTSCGRCPSRGSCSQGTSAAHSCPAEK